MTNQIKIKLGCVREQFFTPLYIATNRLENYSYNKNLNNNLFVSKGLELKIEDCPSGTGDMLNKLKSKELDCAILVTEGFIASKLNGNDDLIGIGTYVSSPLCWAASTGNNRGEIQKIEDLKEPKFGISRFSSGSHIMALYLAHLKGWNPNNLEFKVHQNLTGLANGVTSEDSDLFLWDHFTTKPHYDDGSLRKIGEVVPPWSSFTIVTTKSFLSQTPVESIQTMLEGIQSSIDQFTQNFDHCVDFIHECLGYNVEDIKAWYKTVQYPKRVTNLDYKQLINCTKVLQLAQEEDKANNVDIKNWIDLRIAQWDNLANL